MSTAYSVEKAGSVLQPADAVDALNTLETQELAIILSQVVQSKAERKYTKNKVFNLNP